MEKKSEKLFLTAKKNNPSKDTKFIVMRYGFLMLMHREALEICDAVFL